MSQFDNHDIQGNANVSRRLNVGTNARVNGSTFVGHDLFVGGWLEARNIKGYNKGLFQTVEKLREAYPRPNGGWCALVGDTLPAMLYVARGGEWVSTGKTAGETTIDCVRFTEELEELREELLSHVESCTDDASLEERITRLEGMYDALRAEIDGRKNRKLSLAELDSMGAFGPVKSLALNQPFTRWAVTDTDNPSLTVGILDLFGDNMGHQVTQLLTTHLCVEDGSLTSVHTDSRIHTYFRSYSFRSGSWTLWQEQIPEALDRETADRRAADDALLGLWEKSDPADSLPLRLVVTDESSRAGLPLEVAEARTLSCRVLVGRYDISHRYKSWSVRRVSGDSLADELWNASAALSDSHTIRISWNDVGENAPASFTFSAVPADVPDASPLEGSIVLDRCDIATAYSMQFAEGDYVPPQQARSVYIPLTVQVFYLGHDITDSVPDSAVTWTRYTEDNDGNRRTALDNAWASKMEGAGKAVILRSADLDIDSVGPSVIRFTATVQIADPGTKKTVRMTRSISQ